MHLAIVVADRSGGRDDWLDTGHRASPGHAALDMIEDGSLPLTQVAADAG